MPKIKNLLVPADFSKGFNHALRYAVEIAKSMESRIHIIHVIEPIVFPSDIVITNYNLSELPNELGNFAKKELEKIDKFLKKKGIIFKIKILHGTIYEEILNYSIANHIDIICIATHGHRNLENMLFGSTTEKVLRKAICPVLSVRIINKEK